MSPFIQSRMNQQHRPRHAPFSTHLCQAIHLCEWHNHCQEK